MNITKTVEDAVKDMLIKITDRDLSDVKVRNVTLDGQGEFRNMRHLNLKRFL